MTTDAASSEISLMSLYEEGGPQPKKVAQTLKKRKDWAFPYAATEEALAAIPTRDPDLRRTRSLVYELSDDDRLGLPAVTFGARVIAKDMPESLKPWPPRRKDRPGASFPDPAEALAAISEELGSTLRVVPTPGDTENQLKARRAHNTLMLATDYLSVAMSLAAEDAVPILREALGSPKGLTAKRPNPRRVRMGALTDSSFGRDRIREVLELLQPWITRLDEMHERVERSVEKAEGLQKEVERKDDRVDELAARIAELEDQLGAATRETEGLKTRYRDSGAKASSDVRQVRGRVAAHLESRLRTKLSTAAEALGVETPRVSVANRMVEEAIEELEGELAWLRSSD